MGLGFEQPALANEKATSRMLARRFIALFNQIRQRSASGPQKEPASFKQAAVQGEPGESETEISDPSPLM